MMKLYVWCDPYPVPYGSSMLISVAENLREAKKQALTAPIFSYGKFEEQRDVSDIELGKPDRVVPLPYAEWHEWAE